MADPTGRRRAAGTASVLAVAELVSWGVLYYALAVLLDPMSRNTGWSTAAISGAFSLALLTAGLLAPAVGAAIDRYGPRWVMSVGSLLGVGGVVGWAQATTLPQLYLAWLTIGAAMACTLYEPAFATIVRFHRDQQRSAILVIAVVGALAATVFQPLTGALLASLGWRDTTVVLALVLLLVTLPCHLRLPSRSPTASVMTPESPGSPESAASPLIARAAIVLAVVNGAVVAVTVHLVAFLVAVGTSPAAAAWLAGAVGVAKVAGRLAATALSHRWDAVRVMTWTLAVQAAALLLPVLSRAEVLLVVHVGLFGATAGALTVLRPWLVEQLVGAAAFARTDGRIQRLVAFAKAGGPWLLGVVGASGAGYDIGWLVAAMSVALAAHQLAHLGRAHAAAATRRTA